VFKSIIAHAAETGCLRAKMVAKLNSTEKDFWRHSAQISRKDKIRNIIIKQKMNITRSLLDDIRTKQLKWYGHVQRMEEGRLPKEVMKWSPPGRRKRGRPKLTWAEGIRGLMGKKGINGRRLERQRQLEEEDNIIVKWAEEGVETLYSLLNNNNNNNNNMQVNIVCT